MRLCRSWRAPRRHSGGSCGQAHRRSAGWRCIQRLPKLSAMRPQSRQRRRQCGRPRQAQRRRDLRRRARRRRDLRRRARQSRDLRRRAQEQSRDLRRLAQEQSRGLLRLAHLQAVAPLPVGLRRRPLERKAAGQQGVLRMRRSVRSARGSWLSSGRMKNLEPPRSGSASSRSPQRWQTRLGRGPGLGASLRHRRGRW